MKNKDDLTTGLFRMSALIYANNNDGIISSKQICKKVIEDSLIKISTTAIPLSELMLYIQENYGGLSFSYEELENIIDTPKYKEHFDSYIDNDIKMVSLNGKRRITLENLPKVKNLQTYIEEYISNNGIDPNKIEIFRQFFYGVFTTNLSAYKKLLQEDYSIDVPEESYSEEDRLLINGFLNSEDPEKNKAIYNFASSALEFCMMTNKKNTTLEFNNLKNKNLYLDTNIIFRAIGLNGEDRKIRTRSFLRNIARSNLQQHIFITKKTEQEFRETLSYQLERLEDALKPTPNVNPKVYNEFITIDGIYKLYFKWKAGRSNSSIELFKAHILASYETLKETYKITKDSMVPFNENNETIKENISAYASSIRKFDPEKQFIASEIDAYNIMWIEYKRGDSNNDIFNTKDFIISSDQALRIWDYNRNSNEAPIVMLPSQWLSLILRYLSRTDDDYKSFVCFLNMKVNSSVMSEEQLLYAIEGISETTSDILQQKHLITQLIKSDYQKKLCNLSSTEIIEKTKSFAQTEQDKIINSLEKNKAQNEDNISQLEEINRTQSTEIEKLKTEKTELQESHKIELEQKDSEISRLESTIEEQKLKNWKRPRFIFILMVSILLIAILTLCFIYKSENWNIISKLITWIDSLDDTQKEIAKSITFGTYSILVLLVAYSWVALFSVKNYKNRKGWLKKVAINLWNHIS